MNVFTYPVTEIKKEKEFLIVAAGIKSVDQKKQIRWEGFTLSVANNVWNKNTVTFAVLGVKEEKEGYALLLHTHDGETNVCCEGDTQLIVSRDLLKKWTGLDGHDVDAAFRNISVGSTYNLLATLPRTIIVTKKEVHVQTGTAKGIDSLNVCSLILEGKYPMDR